MIVRATIARSARSLLGGVAAGEFADAAEAVEGCVRVTSVVEPEPNAVRAYAEAISEYRALDPALRKA